LLLYEGDISGINIVENEVSTEVTVNLLIAIHHRRDFHHVPVSVVTIDEVVEVTVIVIVIEVVPKLTVEVSKIVTVMQTLW
jgi:hypothetical protein